MVVRVCRRALPRETGGAAEAVVPGVACRANVRQEELPNNDQRKQFEGRARTKATYDRRRGRRRSESRHPPRVLSRALVAPSRPASRLVCSRLAHAAGERRGKWSARESEGWKGGEGRAWELGGRGLPRRANGACSGDFETREGEGFERGGPSGEEERARCGCTRVACAFSHLRGACLKSASVLLSLVVLGRDGAMAGEEETGGARSAPDLQVAEH